GKAVTLRRTIDCVRAHFPIQQSRRGQYWLHRCSKRMCIGIGSRGQVRKVLGVEREVLVAILPNEWFADVMNDLVPLLLGKHGVPSKHEAIAIAGGLPERVRISSELQLVACESPRQRIQSQVAILSMAGDAVAGIQLRTGGNIARAE